MPTQKLDEQIRRWKIGFGGDFFDDTAIIEVGVAAVVKIFGIVADVEDAIALYAIGLMNLKIETDRFHPVKSRKLALPTRYPELVIVRPMTATSRIPNTQNFRDF